MNYTDQWKALSSCIQGLTRAGSLYIQTIANRSDSYGGYNRISAQIREMLNELTAFRDTFRDLLSPAAVSAIDGFINENANLIAHTGDSVELLQNRMWVALTALAALESRMSFLLSDNQEAIHARSERAFSHLQRSIVVDNALRERWKEAFERGEVACEGLGAVHLLLHGIWAFKVDAVGARTDLVFQEAVPDISEPQRYSDGLVLTEWKKAKGLNDAKQQWETARAQAQRYALGPLASTELRNYRYLIVVSDQRVLVPDDLGKDNVVYRHINIAVDPEVPSRG